MACTLIALRFARMARSSRVAPWGSYGDLSRLRRIWDVSGAPAQREATGRWRSELCIFVPNALTTSLQIALEPLSRPEALTERLLEEIASMPSISDAQERASRAATISIMRDSKARPCSDPMTF
jgi:hypothetical protein